MQPEGFFISPDEAYKDVTYDIANYVHLDSMPEELKVVVKHYINVRNRISTCDVKRLKEVVAELNKVVSALPDDPEVPAIIKIVPGIRCVDIVDLCHAANV